MSDERVDERCDGGCLRKDHEEAEERENGQEWQKHPLLSHANEIPEFDEEGEFAHRHIVALILIDQL